LSPLRKSNEKKSALRYKSFAVFIFFIVINTSWIIFFYDDQYLSIFYGILTPLLYALVYYNLKKIRRKFKSKIKAYIYIPIAYTFFGIVWYAFASLIIKVSDKIDGSVERLNPVSIEVNIDNDLSASNELQDAKNLFEKLNIKTFFLFNPNLAYPCKIVIETESFFDKKHNHHELHYSKYQTNNIILFTLLLLIQSLGVYIAEKIIYPRIKPQSKVVRKKRYNRLEIPDDFQLSAPDLQNKNSTSNEDISSNYPKL
jgi:hypothetical protein